MVAKQEQSMNETDQAHTEEAAMNEAVAAFDLEAWINGMTNIRRAVTIYADMAGNAEIDALNGREKELRLSGASTKEIRAVVEQRRQVAARVASSALDVVFEGRTATALAAVSKDAKDAGLDGVDLVYEVMASQIVEPAGFDADLLAQIAENYPAQYAQLLATWRQVNEEAGVSIPFSQGS